MKNKPLTEPRSEAEQKAWVKDVTDKLNGNVAVADATGAGDVVTQLNALLAELRLRAIIRSS